MCFIKRQVEHSHLSISVFLAHLGMTLLTTNQPVYSFSSPCLQTIKLLGNAHNWPLVTDKEIEAQRSYILSCSLIQVTFSWLPLPAFSSTSTWFLKSGHLIHLCPTYTSHSVLFPNSGKSTEMHWPRFSFILCVIYCLSLCCLSINLLISFWLISCFSPVPRRWGHLLLNLRRPRSPPSDVNSIKHPLCFDIPLLIPSWLSVSYIFFSTEKSFTSALNLIYSNSMLHPLSST